MTASHGFMPEASREGIRPSTEPQAGGRTRPPERRAKFRAINAKHHRKPRNTRIGAGFPQRADRLFLGRSGADVIIEELSQQDRGVQQSPVAVVRT